nr:o-succinylbenzoate synthase [Corynebacterium lactis]
MPETAQPQSQPSPLPPLDDILARAHVVALPMAVKFRGVTTREALLIDGPAGWGEFAPFLEYDARESSAWLRSALECAWVGLPAPRRESVEVNATIPAVAAVEVAGVVKRYPGCRTFKVKVAEAGQSLADDIARVEAVRAAVRKLYGFEPRVRVDANRGWSVDQAIAAAHALGELEYMEQPVASVAELRRVRDAVGDFCRVAADESIRKAEDPYLVAREGAADVGVMKVAPLGGPRRLLRLADELALDVTVASALDTGVGIAAGLFTVAALPATESQPEPAAAGLATSSLFIEDVIEPRPLVDGRLPVTNPAPDPARLEGLVASGQRRDWWFERVRRAYGFLAG